MKLTPFNAGLILLIAIFAIGSIQQPEPTADAASEDFVAEDFASDDLGLEDFEPEIFDAPPEPIVAETLTAADCKCDNCQCGATADKAPAATYQRVCEGGVCRIVKTGVQSAGAGVQRVSTSVRNRQPVRGFIRRLFGR